MPPTLSWIKNHLPAHLRERITAFHGKRKTPPSPPEFVLYWVRVSARGEENPALDAAIVLANALTLPLLVYHGVDERYPYANDRLHTFILEGARELSATLAARHIPYALCLWRPGHRQDALLLLGQRAALVITDEMPVEPLRSFTERIAGRLPCPTVLLDTSCLVPMPLTDQPYFTGATFRAATKALRNERIIAPWEPQQPAALWELPAGLGFEPVAIATASIPELVAACDIDHSIAPVADTRGGSAQGYARWEAFASEHLEHYHSRRGDPSAHTGSSRLSAYLHFGHIAATKIAREAKLTKGRGTYKYLNELLIWREVAYHFCFHTKGHESLEILPDWAKESLLEHAKDARPALYTLEQLSRAKTQDEVWNVGQRSLLRHGELHNNFRMTWGKTLITWRPDPLSSLSAAIDLNHRYALDGRDPSSYGGLLWCFGQFDSPYSEREVFGKVRPKHTKNYGAKKPVEAWEALIDRPLVEGGKHVGILGAGLAGLFAARTLQDHGITVTLFDKGSRPGGRCATRHIQGDEGLQFDHGAQYFTLRSEQFRRLGASWQEAGVIAPWTMTLAQIDGPGTWTVKEGAGRFVGTPGMRSLPEHLAGDLDALHLQTRIVKVEAGRARWVVTDESGGEHGPFDALILNMPPAQAAELLGPVHKRLAKDMEALGMEPCWAVMVEFEAPLDVPFDAAFVNIKAGALGWVAREGSKPERLEQRHSWMLHAAAGWSKAHLEDEKQEVVDALVRDFAAALGRELPPVAYAAAHRWRYSKPPEDQEPCSQASHFWDASAQLGLCGDWCAGGRVEGALRSGSAMAGRVLGHWRARAVEGG